MKLQHARVVLTGATGGIGQELLEQLLTAGAQVLIVGRRRSALDALAAGRRQRMRTVEADLATRAGRDAVEAAVRDWGGASVLLHASGLNELISFAAQDEESIEALLSVNVTATLQLTRRLLPMLQQQPQAMVVLLGSVLGSIGHPGYATYCASKFALRGFAEALRRELADTGVQVRYVAPRATRTSMHTAAAVRMNEQLGSTMDTPQRVAQQVLQAMQGTRHERYLGWPEKLFVRINQILPGVVDKAMRKKLPQIRQEAGPSRVVS